MKPGLQKVRKAAGWKSARAYAEHLGIPVDTYTQYEQGKRTMNIIVAWEIADDLGCTLDAIAGRDFQGDSKD